MKHTKKEIISVGVGMFIVSSPCKYFNNSSEKAPSARGINKRNENLTALSFSIPEYNEVEIVIPDLETPGSSASDCIKPIIIEFL